MRSSYLSALGCRLSACPVPCALGPKLPYALTYRPVYGKKATSLRMVALVNPLDEPSSARAGARNKNDGDRDQRHRGKDYSTTRTRRQIDNYYKIIRLTNELRGSLDLRQGDAALRLVLALLVLVGPRARLVALEEQHLCNPLARVGLRRQR